MGGIGNLDMAYMQALPRPLIANTSCGIPAPDALTLLHGPENANAMPWLAFLLGQTPASVWYWCSDQVRWNVKGK